VFQIVYPPTVALLPPPARVNLISPNTEEGRVLLRWIEAEDPALASNTQRPPGAKSFALPKPEHVPSYLTSSPALKELPPYGPDLSIPSSQPPGPVPIRRSGATKEAGIIATAVTFSPETEGLHPAVFPEMRFSASSPEPPETAEFHVGISEHGAVLYSLLRHSSGDPALDEQARRYLLLCRFPGRAAGEEKAGVIWARATIAWGNDVIRRSGPSQGSAPP
jgi:hypothetical protein